MPISCLDDRREGRKILAGGKEPCSECEGSDIFNLDLR